MNIHSGHDLVSSLLESAFCQHMHKPTREINILDLVPITKESLVIDVNLGNEFGSSDHRMISIKIKNKVDVKTSEERRLDCRRPDFDKLRNLLPNADWSETMQPQM